MKITTERERYEAPAYFQKLLELAAGTNPFGEPLYRFIWGWNWLQWIGGKWTDWDKSTGLKTREVVEMRCVPKYAPDRWYVARWYAPALPRAQWEAATLETEDGRLIPQLGPYPSRGEYQHFFTLEGPEPEKAFRQLTIERAVWLAGVVWASERAAKKTLQQEKDALAEREAKQQAEDDEALDETIPAFGYQPRVTVL